MAPTAEATTGSPRPSPPGSRVETLRSRTAPRSSASSRTLRPFCAPWSEPRNVTRECDAAPRGLGANRRLHRFALGDPDQHELRLGMALEHARDRVEQVVDRPSARTAARRTTRRGRRARATARGVYRPAPRETARHRPCWVPTRDLRASMLRPSPRWYVGAEHDHAVRGLTSGAGRWRGRCASRPTGNARAACRGSGRSPWRPRGAPSP